MRHAPGVAPPSIRPTRLPERLAGALAALVLVAGSWPLLLSPSTRVLGHTRGDFATIAWGLWRVATGRFGPHHADVRFPDGGTLVIADLPEALALAPLTRLAGPVLSFNLLQAGHVVLAAWAAAKLASARGLSTAGAVLAGLGFAFMPVMTASLHSGNPEVTPWFLVPLAALAAGAMDRSTPQALAAGLLVGLAAWCNPYVAVMAGLAAVVAAPWSRSRAFLARGLLLTVVALGIGAASVLLLRDSLADPSSMLHKDRVPPGFPGPAWLRGFAWPDVDRGQTGGAVHAWYVGLSTLLLGTLGALRRPRWSLRWVLLAAVGVLLALGHGLHLVAPTDPHSAGLLPLPGHWLAALPGFSQMRLVFRFAALASLGLGIVAGAAVDALPRPARVAAVMVVVADLLFVAPGWRWLGSSPVTPTPACALLADLPEGAVVDLPGTTDGRYLLAQTCHGRAVAQGVHQPWADGVRRAFQAPPPASPARLRLLGFRWLVLHNGVRGDRDAQIPALMRIAAARGAVVADTPEVVVVDLDKAVAP